MAFVPCVAQGWERGELWCLPLFSKEPAVRASPERPLRKFSLSHAGGQVFQRRSLEEDTQFRPEQGAVLTPPLLRPPGHTRLPPPSGPLWEVSGKSWQFHLPGVVLATDDGAEREHHVPGPRAGDSGL